MRHMADTGQGFSTKTVSSDVVQILKLLQLAGCESLTYYFHILLLETQTYIYDFTYTYTYLQILVIVIIQIFLGA